ncbi:AzlD family protein [Halococcus qingdaonensis]|uniref:AzlD family protein n=1 Tax=Halococcus qingdaonensis TaxID=224402 RepID=UPI0021172273|nr:AzlD domain-containing protein [Halococcus qingdaonensis]
MSSALALDPTVVALIVGMAAVTYATKAGGLWLVGRIDLSERAEAGLDVLPGAVVVAFIAPALADGGVPEWVAAGATVAVAHKTGSLLLSLGVGVGTVLAARSIV